MKSIVKKYTASSSSQGSRTKPQVAAVTTPQTEAQECDPQAPTASASSRDQHPPLPLTRLGGGADESSAEDGRPDEQAAFVSELKQTGPLDMERKPVGSEPTCTTRYLDWISSQKGGPTTPAIRKDAR